MKFLLTVEKEKHKHESVELRVDDRSYSDVAISLPLLSRDPEGWMDTTFQRSDKHKQSSNCFQFTPTLLMKLSNIQRSWF